ncbi:11450_t:CDS:2 [Gigaspora rosea]|nr:11450_t:CDS:2 [Gigaspora rosea]
MTSGMIRDELMIEAIRLPLTKLRVAESTEYNQELEGYYLIIEIGLPPAYQMENVHIVIHDDNENAVRDTEDSPPYEEFTSPPNCNHSNISLPPPVYSEH